MLQVDGISDCEVILTDDGSSDETPTVLEEFRRKSPDNLRVLRIPNGGPARARNYALREAKNERILFIDDDVFPRAGMLQSHGRMLDAGYTGSQGILVWHPEIEITPLIRYIDSRGSMFDFERAEDTRDLSFTHVYTGNFAVLRSAVLNVGGFDEKIFEKNIANPFFEDTILAYRLVQNGGRLGLNREAIADHLHDFNETGFLDREYKIGYSIGRLRGMYPDVAKRMGWDRKDFLAEAQVQLLRLLNASSIPKRLLAYPLSMRLRNREAFYQGFLQFKRDAAR